uniref:Uncharacterized protein n=1 Tax=Knipowitschia caucasica TaxID=637954 RepID=A0AAV2LEZ2_KNICA
MTPPDSFPSITCTGLTPVSSLLQKPTHPSTPQPSGIPPITKKTVLLSRAASLPQEPSKDSCVDNRAVLTSTDTTSQDQPERDATMIILTTVSHHEIQSDLHPSTPPHSTKDP